MMVLDLECLGNQAALDAGFIRENIWDGFFPVVNATHLHIQSVSLLAEADVEVLEHCFAVVFLLELAYRIWTDKCKYFKEAMNLFDTASKLTSIPHSRVTMH